MNEYECDQKNGEDDEQAGCSKDAAGEASHRKIRAGP